MTGTTANQEREGHHWLRRTFFGSETCECTAARFCCGQPESKRTFRKVITQQFSNSPNLRFANGVLNCSRRTQLTLRSCCRLAESQHAIAFSLSVEVAPLFTVPNGEVIYLRTATHFSTASLFDVSPLCRKVPLFIPMRREKGFVPRLRLRARARLLASHSNSM